MDRFIRAQNVQRYRNLLERWSKLVRQTVFDWPNLRIQALRTEARYGSPKRRPNARPKKKNREKLLSLLAEEEQKQKDAGAWLRPEG